MKSILQEANSIERAIDKAWNQAGKPKEFSIKVLDEGERNFLGLSRRPAIVTILYKPEKATAAQQIRKDRDESPREDWRERRDRAQQSRETRVEGTRPQPDARRQDNKTGRRYAGSEEQRTAFQNTLEEGWRDQWKDFVHHEIREVLRLMGITVMVEATVIEEKTLSLSFAQPAMDDNEEQKLLFTALAYVGLQFLKRMYKNRFAGLKVVVTGPTVDGSSSMTVSSDDSLPRSFDQRAPARSNPQQGQSTERGNDRGGDRGNRRGNGQGRDRRDGERRPRREFNNDRQSSERDGLPNPMATDHVMHVAADQTHDVLADQMRFAKEQLSKEGNQQESSRGVKKDKKYPPFFVLEDEEQTK